MLLSAVRTPSSPPSDTSLSWDRNPPLSQYRPEKDYDPEFLSRFCLHSELLRSADPERILNSLNRTNYARRLVDLLFRGRSECCDFYKDRIKEASRARCRNIRPSLSADDLGRFRREQEFLSDVMQKISDHGHVPNWIDLSKRIIREASLELEHYHHVYNAIRAISLIAASPRLICGVLERSTTPEARDKAIEEFSLEPALCFTERNRSPGRLFEWTLKTFNEPLSASGLKSYWIWMDAPLGLLLTRNGEPQVIMSFSLDVAERAVVVEQIQGISGTACKENGEGLDGAASRLFGPKLFGLDHRQCCLELAETIAVQCGLNKVVVLGGVNNIWTKPNKWKTTPTFTTGAAKRIYDIPASERGYCEREDGNWELVMA